MKLGLWLGLALSAAVALPAIGCLGAPFGTSTGAGGGTGTGGASTTSTGAGGDSCVPPTQSCSHDCVDLEVDTSNCGACGNHCKTGQQCVARECKCPTGTELCNDGCVDKESDPDNCGACGHVCQGGQVCTSGNCACPTDLPDTCDGACTNKQKDATNCGTCGHVCPSMGGCNAGTCGVCNGTICGSTCIDTKTDGSNCGTCGHHCGPSSTCTNSVCTCDLDKKYCSDQVGCIDVKTDATHCGSCDKVCSSGDSCTSGVCTCPGGGVDCGSDNCAVVAFSPTDCGKCGAQCNDSQACNNGTCGCRQPEVLTAIGCSDPKHDPARCGLANVACNTSIEVCAPGFGCVLETACTGNGGVSCDGGCYAPADFQSNPFHCGGCDSACHSNEVCVAGNCRPFTVPPSCTASTCGNGGACCAYPGIPGDTICVDGGACPAPVVNN